MVLNTTNDKQSMKETCQQSVRDASTKRLFAACNGYFKKIGVGFAVAPKIGTTAGGVREGNRGWETQGGKAMGAG